MRALAAVLLLLLVSLPSLRGQRKLTSKLTSKPRERVEEETETHNFTAWVEQSGGSMGAIRIGRAYPQPAGCRAGAACSTQARGCPLTPAACLAARHSRLLAGLQGSRAARGVLATRAIPKGEVVSRVPLSLLINIEHVLVRSRRAPSYALAATAVAIAAGCEQTADCAGWLLAPQVDPVLGPLLDENRGEAGIVHAWLGDTDALAV